MQLSMLNSFIVYQKDGQKIIPGISTQSDAAFLFGNGNGADMEILREENITRLTECHYVLPVTETASKQKLQKTCKVCNKKGMCKDGHYNCQNCPSSPGLCFFPCFELYHTKFNYWV